MFRGSLTRLYTPQDFGIYGVFVAVCATMAGVAGGRLELAIPVAKTADVATTLLLLTGLVALPASIVLSAFVAWLGPLFGLGPALGGEMAYWLPVAAFSIVVFQAVNYWLLWNKDYSRAARARWVQGGALATVQLGAGYLAFGSWGLLVGHTLAQLLGGLIGGGATAAKRAMDVASQLSWRKCTALLRAHRNYPFVMAPAALLNMLGQHMPILLIGGLYGVKAAGFYAIAQRVCGAPLALVGQAIGQIFAAEAPNLMQRSPENMLLTFSRLIRYMFLGGGLFIIVLVVAAPIVVGFVFGKEWVDAGVLMQILSFVFVLEFVVTPVSLTLSFMGHHSRQLWWDVIRLSGILATFALATVLALSLYQAMVVLAIVLSLSHIYLLRLMWNGLKKLSPEDVGSDASALRADEIER
ncbi:lipopolysaccharide biosynthesis protein [Pusillimonas sp. NJUB218]|uniref:lipopolysaccharide biosynthesis protein n=1 Tax=Pusillimonas sp. NJUB218 TaxID=2023230 RepID=UPI0013154322|nr:lipopolysaccharide biosynthesis protein [Pusillimonas sp. NJUB218]